MVKLTIDNREVEVPEGTTILDAAAAAGLHIPTLCGFPDLNEIGACRVCVVEVEGYDRLLSACNTEALDGMVIHTNAPMVRTVRKTNVELILSQHNMDCPVCVKSGNCTLQTIANDLGIIEVPYTQHIPEASWPSCFPLIRDESKCIKCYRCIQVCSQVQHCDIWDLKNRATRTTVGVTNNIPIETSRCSLCGQCITHCPVGALRERDDTDRVWAALADPNITVVAQIAPAVRTAWGETLGLDRQFATDKRLAAALRRLGFDYVFDTNFAADLTIMEEGSEFLRLMGEENSQLPLFTSCCPGWVRFVKGHYPELVGYLSSSKSPQQMFGATLKGYTHKVIDVDPKNIFCVSIMPCVAKKYECAVPEMINDLGDRDVDVVLTTREVDRMIRADAIEVADLEEEEFDQPMGLASGAGMIFGATGGVMEAALRSAYVLATGNDPDPDLFQNIRGRDGWREETITIGDTTFTVAVAHGLGNAERLIKALKSGEVSYDFVEVMACPGGCAGGGGQPTRDQVELAGVRGEVLYRLDAENPLRISCKNPMIQEVYEEFFDAPLSETAEKYLHTDQSTWSLVPAECQVK